MLYFIRTSFRKMKFKRNLKVRLVKIVFFSTFHFNRYDTGTKNLILYTKSSVRGNTYGKLHLKILSTGHKLYADLILQSTLHRLLVTLR